MSPATRYHLTIDEAREDGLLRTGDLLLYRGTGRISRIIQTITRSEYSHAAMYGEVMGGVAWVAEVREWVGGRNTALKTQVEWFPGQIDVFTVDRARFPEYDGQRAFSYMMLLAGCRYGYWAVRLAWLKHCWFMRLLMLIPPFGMLSRKSELKPYGDAMPPYCSMAVDRAAVYAGVDPVEELDSRFTEPGDLAQSLLYRYACTLVLDKETDE